MASGSINITIGGKDRLSPMLASVAKSVKGFVDGTVEGMRKAVAQLRAEYGLTLREITLRLRKESEVKNA